MMPQATICPSCHLEVFGLSAGSTCSVCQRREAKRILQQTRAALDDARGPVQVTCVECGASIDQSAYANHLRVYHPTVPNRINIPDVDTGRKFLAIRNALGISKNCDAISIIIDAQFNAMHLSLDTSTKPKRE